MDNKVGKINQEIQALRGVAIIFVLLHHYQILLPRLPPSLYQYVEGLWSGVDLFFCISGYVISRNIIPILQTKHGINFWREALAFWIRRSYRIWPTAWLWSGITFLITIVMAKGNIGYIFVNLGDLLSAVFQVANFHFWQCSADANHQCGVMSIYWSLSLEEQFYLFFPLVVYIFRKKLPHVLLFLLVIQIFFPRTHWQGISSFIRTDAVILGIFLALMTHRGIYKIVEPTNLLIPTNLLLTTGLIFSVAAIATLKIVSFYIGLIAAVCFIILWLASYDKGYLFKPSVIRWLLAKVGERSFSVYLIHFVSFSIVRVVMNRFFTSDTDYMTTVAPYTLILGVCLTAGLAELNFRFVETRWRLRGKKAALALSIGDR